MDDFVYVDAYHTAYIVWAMITVQRLKELLHYDPETGLFTWLVTRNGMALSGQNAGTSDARGYRMVHIDYKRHMLHRLAWLYMTGSFPDVSMAIDHINRVKDDNRWCNLRLATRSQNCTNMDLKKNNTSGVKGVSKNGNNWAAFVSVNRKRHYLGTFPTIEEAAKARKDAELKYYGEFAA